MNRYLRHRRKYHRLWRPYHADLIAWYDASDNDTLTQSAGLVSEIRDKSGNGLHLSQATGADQPAIDGRTINGIQALSWEFTEQDGFMSRTGLSISTTVISTAGIYQYPSGGGTNFDYIFSIEHSNDAANIRIQSGGSSRDMRLNSSAGLTEEIDAYGDIPFIATSISPSAASTTFRMNGTAATTVYTENTVSDITEIHIGHDSADNGNNFRGLLGEFCIFRNATVGILQKFEGYLAWKWSGEL